MTYTVEGKRVDERLAERARAEFLEMPGLSLTRDQAQRLWCLDRPTCDALLVSLVESRFLRRNERGHFVLHAAPHRERRTALTTRRVTTGVEARA
jgi:hypothetical protein